MGLSRELTLKFVSLRVSIATSLVPNAGYPFTVASAHVNPSFLLICLLSGHHVMSESSSNRRGIPESAQSRHRRRCRDRHPRGATTDGQPDALRDRPISCDRIMKTATDLAAPGGSKRTRHPAASSFATAANVPIRAKEFFDAHPLVRRRRRSGCRHCPTGTERDRVSLRGGRRSTQNRRSGQARGEERAPRLGRPPCRGDGRLVRGYAPGNRGAWGSAQRDPAGAVLDDVPQAG